MPYTIRMRDQAPSHCVVKVDTGEVAKCHGTHAEAEAHRDALNIATSGEGNPTETREHETEEERRRRLARQRQRRTVRGYAEDCINRMLGR